MKHLIGIDLGTINDWTAVSVVQRYGAYERVRVPRPGSSTLYTMESRWQFKEYRLLHLERYMGEPYTEIIRRVKALLELPSLKGARIVVDATGVGRPVVDHLKAEGLKRLTPVIITGGDSVTKARVNGLEEYRVPKRDLVGVLQVLLQNRELKIQGHIELKRELITEMQNFKIKLNAETGHASFEHWRASDHDDLVLSVALACWYEEHRRKGPFLKASMIPI